MDEAPRKRLTSERLDELDPVRWALSEEEEWYREVVDHSRDLLCVHDLRGGLLSVNLPAARALGYAPNELLEMPMRDIVPPEFRAGFDAYLSEIARKGETQGLLAVMTRKGERRIWEYRNTLRTRGESSPVVCGIAHDVTEERRFERELHQHAADLARAQSVAHVGTWRFDMAQHAVTCSEETYRILGLPSAIPITADTVEAAIHPDDRERVEHAWMAAHAESKLDVECRIPADNLVRWVRCQASFESDAQGQPVALVGTIQDITDSKQTEDLLRRNEERIRVAVKNSPVTVFNQDRDLRYTWIYNSHLYRPDEVIGKTDDELFGAGNTAQLTEMKRRVLKTGVGTRQEVVVLHEGKSHSFDATIEPLLDLSGNVVGITGTGMNIAHLCQVADRLREQRDQLLQEKYDLRHEIPAEVGVENIIGESPILKDVLTQVRVVAPTRATVLLLGETGTGKELIARSIHQLSPRREKDFIKLNCAALPAGLLESELFGFEKGAFTGAVRQKPGLLELANEGTLFLDEIGELPLELQPKLLRVLQDQEFEHLGGVHTLQVDVRVVAATNRDLKRDVLARKFREDLFYRLNVFPLRLPPLRERSSDIPRLVHHFLDKHCARMKKRIDHVSNETMQALIRWSWPGNIRELENLIERLVIVTRGSELILPAAELTALPDSGTEGSLGEVTREHIIRVLREAEGVLSGPTGAASRLGLKRQTLQSMLRRLEIDPQEYRRRPPSAST